ncbi:MAG: Ig-like domain-containing protein, partial [Aeromonas sp.]
MVSGTVSGGEFEAGDVVTLTINKIKYTGTVDAAGNFSIDVLGSDLAADADHTIDANVTSTDAAGNSSSATTTQGYGVDTALPTITVDVPENTNDTTPTITGTTDAPVGSVVTIVVTDSAGHKQTLTTTVVAGGNYSVDVVTPLPEGGFTANATVSDPAGNQGSSTDDGIVDVTAPAIGMTLDPNITSDDVINAAEEGNDIPVSGKVSGQFNLGDTVTLTVNGKDFTGKLLSADGSFSINVPGSDLVADADHTINASVTSTDAAGNSSTVTATDEYGVDDTLPSITVAVPENTNDTTPIITGKTDAPVGSTVTIVVTDSAGNEQTLTATVDKDGTYSVVVITPLPEGSYSANASVTDAAGNTFNNTDSGIVDVTAPVIGIKLDPNITADDIINATEEGKEIPVSGTVSGQFNQGDTVTLTVNGKDFTGTILGTDGRFSINVPGSDLVADPDHTINASVTSTDAAGNSSSATITEGYGVDTTLPTITVDVPENTNDTTPTITGTTDAP